jgi:hypothetical protein
MEPCLGCEAVPEPRSGEIFVAAARLSFFLRSLRLFAAIILFLLLRLGYRLCAQRPRLIRNSTYFALAFAPLYYR